MPIYETMVRFWCDQWGLKKPEDLEDLLQDLWISNGHTSPQYLLDRVEADEEDFRV